MSADHTPAGERLLWSGAPETWSLARHAFLLRGLALYFTALVVAAMVARYVGGATLASTAVIGAELAATSLAVLALIAGFAIAVHRTTRYTLTDQRLSLRIGVAIPVTITVPLACFASAGLRLFPDGHGDIALTLVRERHISWLMLWPHVRPFRLRRPEPVLRGVRNAERVARLIAGALATDAGQPVRGLPVDPTAGARRPSAQPVAA